MDCESFVKDHNSLVACEGLSMSSTNTQIGNSLIPPINPCPDQVLSLYEKGLMARSCKFWLLALALKLLFTTIMVHVANATEFKVGGSTGTWTVPSDSSSMVYNQWAERNRFQIGDSLLFVYEAEKDSVVWVNKEDYDNCNTGSPMATFRDGRTTFKLSHAGPYYFISGSDGNCAKNEKMVLVVMADRSGKSTPPPEGLPNGQAESPPPPSPSSENGATTMSMKHSTLSFGFMLLGSISLLLAT